MSPMHPIRRRHLHSIALIALVVLATTGCVRRRLTVRSNPPGAIVYVDNQHIGETPCSVDFIYYGTREIRLAKPGYETLTVNQPIPTPWYQYPGIDFISENLVPMRIRDNRNVAFNLAPQRVVPAEEIIGRGEQLRAEVQASATTPIVGAPTLGAPDPFAAPAYVPPAAGDPIPFAPQPPAPQFIAPTTPPPVFTPQPAPASPTPAELFGAPPAATPPPFRY
ncbi:PEGA domain protein [Pirellulimonas nuda]|uniref:PEGA domain protein n=1 Tax=Pirellulimonas nuda TaxID=2528009 RepID=A0A518D8Q0_9BACT|nr:PEGA domain-containing protein [Pirellulimonas nuda]QDU87820.1 PEGA domain protein [Pirellulimonas nuda]